jgi:programmed cell death protein 5
LSDEEVSPEELEALRRRRMMELRRTLMEEQRRVQEQQELEARKQAALKLVLTPEARARLTNIKMVKPEFAEQLELQLIQLAQTGRLKTPLTDEQLKEILKRLQVQRKEFKIRRA